jgi:transposase
MLSKQLRQIALTASLSMVSFRNVRFTATAVATQTRGGIEALVIKGGTEFFAASLLRWKPRQVKKAYRRHWIIEECIKLLKSEFGLESCQARAIPTIRAHAYICLMYFNTLEQFRVKHKYINTLPHTLGVV